MPVSTRQTTDDFDPRFKVFHELMKNKVKEVLLVATPYDAWIMEEDCRLSERIINEYRGLNLSSPPRLSWASTMGEALAALANHRFDLLIIMARRADREVFAIGGKIRKNHPDLPVVFLSHESIVPQESRLNLMIPDFIDLTFAWTGNTDMLLALIKGAEDDMNAAHDTSTAGIRVIIFVEDSPVYMSVLLPILYKELVIQTQAVMEEGLNEEHRLLSMRARPKILVADSYEGALKLVQQYEPYVLCLISDARIPRGGVLDRTAGIDLLKKMKRERFDIPLLLTSAEPQNALKAAEISAEFIDKNASTLISEFRSFILNYLGFGDFVFRTPAGREIARASNLRQLEKNLQSIADESFVHHYKRNDFSRWLFARAEIELASRVRPIRDVDFESIESHRRHLVSLIHRRRMQRQKGVIVTFDPKGFDVDTEFLKIGSGSLGGKARGLAFIASVLNRKAILHEKFEQVRIYVPNTLVLTTEGFDEFIEHNYLQYLAKVDRPDEEIGAIFLKARFPNKVKESLRAYLTRIKYPLAVRSSSLLEDAQFRAYAGLYKTYMLANDHEDPECRLEQLLNAVKMVYASTYCSEPKAFARRVGHRTEEEKMAVVIQQLVGKDYAGYFYPAISGVAQSYNYYPFSKMVPEDGIATIALGLGKTVMEGEQNLRFSPRYPHLLPQRSSVDDILNYSQRFFYALKTGGPCVKLGLNEGATLTRREIYDAIDEPPLRLLSGTYVTEEHRIRDTSQIPGQRVLTFSQVLKYNLFPLADLLDEILSIGQEGMGCPVEIEFSVNLGQPKERRPEFAILQIRPMTAREELMKVDIQESEIQQAFCFSSRALGNGINTDMADIVYIKPDDFDPGRTPQIAQEIGQINATLLQEKRKYLLIGPGRWGSADRWLGIPVSWSDISGVGAMVETAHSLLKAESSQGSHFFHNITTLGINYMTIAEEKGDFIDWKRLKALPLATESAFVAHARLTSPITLKVDGRKSCGVMIENR